MVLKLVTPPASEPVTLAEAKIHLRVDITDDDDYITSLILTARITVELSVWRSLISQTWRYSLDSWPEGNEILLSNPPLQSVSGIVYFLSDGSSPTWAASNYLVDTDSEPGRVVLAYGVNWPGGTLRPLNPIQITYIAGYGDAATDVLAIYRQAMLLLIGHWYENREPVLTTGAVPKELPLAVQSLLWLDRNF